MVKPNISLYILRGAYNTTFLFRFNTSRLSEPRSYAGSSLHPSLGLVMVGSYRPTTSSAESTLDGFAIDTESVPGYGDIIYANCLVSVNDTTLISFGGESPNRRTIAVFTVGNSEWQVRLNLTRGNGSINLRRRQFYMIGGERGRERG